MKKRIIYSSILTCIFIFLPAFLVKFSAQPPANTVDISREIKQEEAVAVFSSKTCFKKTYYINADKVQVFDSPIEGHKEIFTLAKDEAVISIKEQNGYIYCEEGKDGKTGWIKNTTENLKGNIDKGTTYIVDVNITTQKMKIYKKEKIIKEMSCSTGIIGNQDTETPLGTFYLQSKGEYFFSSKYQEGGRYYIKFFSNYLIHSIPVDKKGNIIEGEKNKIGIPVSHGCIRISMKDSKWVYDNVPQGSKIIIHY
ncbi:MAG: L,D-transpeptidase family protein [Solirubrobacterales bacterium]